MRNGVEITEIENGYLVEISTSEPLVHRWGEPSGEPAFYKTLDAAKVAAIAWINDGTIPAGDQ